MTYRTRKPKMTNQQRYCECGSGLYPGTMWQSANRWACLQCYGKAAWATPAPTDSTHTSDNARGPGR